MNNNTIEIAGEILIKTKRAIRFFDHTKRGEKSNIERKVDTMNCPECGTPLVIDEYGGWRWVCFNCDHVGREATDAEIEAQEKEFERLSLKCPKCGCMIMDPFGMDLPIHDVEKCKGPGKLI